MDQGDVDREFPVALDELLGAVERIHEPEPFPAAAFLVGKSAGFLRDNRNVRCDAGKPIENDGVRAPVGFGERGRVVLHVDGEFGPVDLQHGLPRGAGDRVHFLNLDGIQHGAVMERSRPSLSTRNLGG